MSAINHIKLSDLNKQIEDVITNNFNNLLFWIIADITEHSFKEKTGYHYFHFVEKDINSNKLLAKIPGKAWGSGSSRIKDFERHTGQKFTNNINVLIKVKVVYHVEHGLALDVLDIDTNYTVGLLEQQRQATLASLVKLNPTIIQKSGDRYITRNSKLELPIVIQRIAVVSSKTSAGNEDFKHTLINNPYGYKFIIDDYFTVVQNVVNAKQFLQRVIDVFNSKIPYDVVVINRGGGAQTDFLIFDDYMIGLAIAKFPIPIITGIGHQKNETITDLMAHTQTKTPTKAAEFIITHNKNYEDAILSFQKTIIIKSQQIFSHNFQRLSQLNSSIVNNTRTFLNDYKDKLNSSNQIVINNTKSILFQNRNTLNAISTQVVTKPKIIIYNRLNDLSNKISNLKTFTSSYLKNQTGYLGHFVKLIKVQSPDSILKKGFAYIKYNGQITSNADAIQNDTEIEVILSGTNIKSIVKSKTKHNGNEFNL
jgi:exodeoxyribonuclease VII large subunit